MRRSRGRPRRTPMHGSAVGAARAGLSASSRDDDDDQNHDDDDADHDHDHDADDPHHRNDDANMFFLPCCARVYERTARRTPCTCLSRPVAPDRLKVRLPPPLIIITIAST